jgi:hypothetical protein
MSPYKELQETILENPISTYGHAYDAQSIINSPHNQITDHEKFGTLSQAGEDKQYQQLYNGNNKTVVQKHYESNIIPKIDNLDYALGKAKTVCKSGYFHGNDNVILIFRSMEILMDSSGDGSGTSKHHKFSPIYIPVDIVSKLYKFNTKELLKLLFDHVSFNKNSSVKLDYNRLRAHLEEHSKINLNKEEFAEPEKGVIKTSYMYQDTDYGVTIKYPYLEYHNSYKNAIIIRPLITEDDYKLFFKTPVLLNTEWPTFALQ